MRKRIVLWVLFCLLFAWFGKDGQAQNPPQPTLATIQPDCLIPFTLAAAGSFPATTVAGGPGDNRTKGCAAWTLMYQNTGMTSVTVTLQSASTTGTTPSFGSFAGTISTGYANPIVSDTGGSVQATNGTADISWVRVNVAATGTGTLTGVLYGFRNSSAAVAAPVTNCPAGALDQIQYYLSAGVCGANANFVLTPGVMTANPATGSAVLFGADADPFGFFWANVKTQNDLNSSPVSYADYYAIRTILTHTGGVNNNSDLFGFYNSIEQVGGSSQNGILALDANGVTRNAASVSYMHNDIGSSLFDSSHADDVSGVRPLINLYNTSTIGEGVAVRAFLNSDAGTTVSGDLAYFAGNTFGLAGTIMGTLYGLNLPDITQGTGGNFAIKTGLGITQLGDRLYLAADVVNPFIQAKNSQTATAPGAAKCDLRWIAGTNATTGKIVAACGTSATEVTIADNVGNAF